MDENTQQGPLLVYEDLVALGIKYHRDTLRRRVRDGTFPAPIMLSSQRPVWRESDIHNWLASRPRGSVDCGKQQDGDQA